MPFKLPPVHMSYTPDGIDRLLRQHICGARVVGADVEWRPIRPWFKGADGTPALLQLATPSAVVLIPLKHLPEWPPALEELLQGQGACQHGTILCGASVDSDIRKVAAMWREKSGAPASSAPEASGADPGPPAAPEDTGVAPGLRGLDLGAAGQRAGVFPRRQVGLARAVAAMGGPHLAKPKAVQVSDWEQRPLTRRQVEYAAMDAYAGGWVAARLYAAATAAAPKAAAAAEAAVAAAAGAAQQGDQEATEARPKRMSLLEWAVAEAEMGVGPEPEASGPAQAAATAAAAAEAAPLQAQARDPARIAALREAALRATAGAWVEERAVVAAVRAAVQGASRNSVKSALKGLVEDGAVNAAKHGGGRLLRAQAAGDTSA